MVDELTKSMLEALNALEEDKRERLERQTKSDDPIASQSIKAVELGIAARKMLIDGDDRQAKILSKRKKQCEEEISELIAKNWK